METVNCNLCNSSDYNKILDYEYKHDEHKEIFQIVKCNNCNLLFTNPIPELDEIHRYYHDEYSPYHDVSKTKIKIKDKLAFFLKLNYPLFGIYAKNIFGKKLNSLIGKLFQKRIKRKFYNIPEWKKDGVCLDVGCGTAIYLDLLKKIGWQTYGVEINRELAEQNKDHIIYAGRFETAKYENEFFDFVRISHTLEHVYNPMIILKKIYDILKKDGILFLESPNCKSISGKLFGEFWKMWDAPRHLYHFDKDSLLLYFKKIGFEVINFYTICNLHQMKINKNELLEQGKNMVGGYDLKKLKIDKTLQHEIELKDEGDKLIFILRKSVS